MSPTDRACVRIGALLLLLACYACTPTEAATQRAPDAACVARPDAAHAPRLSAALEPFADRLATQTGALVLDTGGQALVTRAWLSEAAEHSIDAQYFIFTADNVGKIATDYLLRAAERGVKVRVIVDDILLDADALELLALDAHPNLSIKVYNPNVNVGKSVGAKLANTALDFRGVNQRMHNKTFIVDGRTVITGGRNIADEYFDYDHDYDFRDRDVLLLGGVAADVQRSFDRFWNDPLSVGVSALLDGQEHIDLSRAARDLHAYACDPDNFWPEVRKQIQDLPHGFEALAENGALQWVSDARFVSDVPGKNAGTQGLGGGGVTTDTLRGLIRGARRQIFIQSPYLVTTSATREQFARAVKRGVQVKILTNSLASTDNLPAFSGYQRDREALLAAGVQIYEWRPDSALRRQKMRSAWTERTGRQPVFALHAKSMVVDGEQLVVGTFNLDPRSANLNTECITVLPSPELARQVLTTLNAETRPENAWHTTADDSPDHHAGLWKRLRVALFRIAPKSVL